MSVSVTLKYFEQCNAFSADKTPVLFLFSFSLSLVFASVRLLHLFGVKNILALFFIMTVTCENWCFLLLTSAMILLQLYVYPGGSFLFLFTYFVYIYSFNFFSSWLDKLFFFLRLSYGPNQ